MIFFLIWSCFICPCFICYILLLCVPRGCSSMPREKSFSSFFQISCWFSCGTRVYGRPFIFFYSFVKTELWLFTGTWYGWEYHWPCFNHPMRHISSKCVVLTSLFDSCRNSDILSLIIFFIALFSEVLVAWAIILPFRHC